MMTTPVSHVKDLNDTVDFQASDQNLVQQGLEQIRQNWGWIVAAGICLIVAGTAAIAAPLVSSLAVEMVVASLLVLGGIAAVVAAFYARQWGGFFTRLISGLLHVVVGTTMAFNPVAGLISLTMLVAIFFGVDGALRIGAALQSRKDQRSWMWILASGILAVACCGIIASQLPVSSLVLIGTLAGIHLVSSGWAHVMLGLEAKQLVVSS